MRRKRMSEQSESRRDQREALKKKLAPKGRSEKYLSVVGTLVFLAIAFGMGFVAGFMIGTVYL
jgi:hypothetical protein